MKKGGNIRKKEGKKEEKKPKSRIIFLLKIIIPVILGFLPSFIYIAMFIQYGSAFTNYIHFLSNLDSSLGAWISAVVIALIIYFFSWMTQSWENFKRIIKNKLFLIIFIVFILVVLFLVSIQLYLYFNLVLGSDILVKLSADKDNIFFIDNPSEEITFKMSVVMNPFCSAQCEYKFFDISKGENIEAGTFNITSILPKSKTYTLNSDYLAQGSQAFNRFEITCRSQKTLLCYTKEDENKRAVLITLNYELSDEEKEFKEDSKEEIISLEKILYSAKEKLNASKINIILINGYFPAESFSQQLGDISERFIFLNNSVQNLKELWITQDFSRLRGKIQEVSNKTRNFNAQSEILNSDIISNISIYNDLTGNLTNSQQILNDISKKNLTSSLCEELNNITSDFNQAVRDFNGNLSLSDKSAIVEDISLKATGLHEKSTGISGDSLCSLGENITNGSLTMIEPVYFYDTIPEISLEEPIPVCCFYGKCGKCCNGNCPDENYPVIFLHGHSMNKALPADYSLDALAEIKEKLMSDRYIDAGAVVISPVSEQGGLWGKINAPITVTASYFFDTYKTETGEKTVSSKTDSIDTYAIRLKSIIELVKYRTNRNKVIIVAHSMGGLVTRRYIQIFGGKEIDKIILITVPNHGIEDKLKDYCAVFGQELTCNEMSKDSILINKLNNAATDKVPAYNIIGTGCSMGSDTGDGIVKNSSQYLDYATNYYVKGTCNELNFEFLHETILRPDKYPEVYRIINQILNTDNSDN